MSTTQQPAPYKPPTNIDELHALNTAQRFDLIYKELTRLSDGLRHGTPTYYALIAALTDARNECDSTLRREKLCSNARAELATMQGPGA